MTTHNRILPWQEPMTLEQFVPECDVYMLTKDAHYQPDDFDDGDIGERIEQYETYQVKNIPLTLIEDPWTYIDDERVAHYAKLDPSTVPPIVLGYYADGSYQTIDGGHRVMAARNRGQSTIRAFVAVRLTNSESATGL